LQELGLRERISRRSYPINGLRLVTPRGHDVVLSSPDDVALICNRRTLDHLLLLAAQDAGVEFIPNFNAAFLLQRSDRVLGFRSEDGREIRVDYTVVAEGAHTRLARERGPREIIQAIMGWWDGMPFQPNIIEMVFDDLVSPYYGWLFPEDDGRVNIGICYEDPNLTQNARRLFDAFLEKHYKARLGSAKQVGIYKGHPISYSSSIGQLTSPGRIVIGEAGRLTHPATAEGIYQGMRSGMLAAQALHDILIQRVDPTQAFRSYEDACRRAFRISFRGASVWRRFVSSGGLDVVTGMLTRPTPRRLLARCMAQM
jgi:flavin-dependent dehydrogenase